MHVAPTYRMVVINFNYESRYTGVPYTGGAQSVHPQTGWMKFHKMYLLNYHSKDVQVIHTDHFGSLFTIKNIVYMSSFPYEAYEPYEDSCDSVLYPECFGINVVNHEQLKLFLLEENGISNYSFSLIQELEDPNLGLFISNNPTMMALPFQTSQSRLRHYKSVPIKDL